jgi:hypothetical protein
MEEFSLFYKLVKRRHRYASSPINFGSASKCKVGLTNLVPNQVLYQTQERSRIAEGVGMTRSCF